MESNLTKSMQKVFVNDLNVQRFSGIFSAHYCWPEDCSQKCWSEVMRRSPEWFVDKLWPKVVDKLPVITADQKSVQQINELMFGLILKELDLLTFSQMQYFEAVLDIFNDDITIGLICWLKICYQFNWRLIYAKQVVSHKTKHFRQLIELILDGIEANERDSPFTSEEISYFYSIVDCICVELLANNVIKKSSDDKQFLTNILAKTGSKLSHLNYDPFVRQLATFNVLTQELIGYTLELIQSDCLCDDIIESQLKQIEDLFINGSEMPIDVSQRLGEDIAIAKDNQKSLKLVNEQYFLNSGSNLVVKSLEEFFNSFDGKASEVLPLKRFHYLSDILNDRQNRNFRQLMEIVLNFADFESFHSLLSLINAIDIIDNDQTLNLAKRVVQITADPKTKNFLTTILIKSLKASETIDLENRLKHLKINKIFEPKIDSIKTLFNQITKDDIDSSLFEELTHELLIGIYLNPFPVYNLVLDLALRHNRAQTGLVAKLICQELYYLSKFRFNDESETFLMKFIVHLLVEKPSIQLMEDMTRLIQQIVNCPLAEHLEPVLTLDELFLYLIKYKSLMKSEVVWPKMLLIKNIIELSGDQSWAAIESNPVPIIVFLLQFLDYFWQNPNRKQIVIDILNLIFDKKLIRNLTEEELTHLDELLAKGFNYTDGKASTYKIFLAYCEKRFPKPVDEVIDVTKNIFHDQILCYATITSDFMWIVNKYPAYEVFCEPMKKAMNYILPALTTGEFHKLFKFIQMYYYNSIAISHLRTAIFATNRNMDKKCLVSNLMDIVINEVLIPMREEMVERPLTYEDFEFIKMDLCLVFKSMATLDYLMLSNDITIRLKGILTELAERMVFEKINAYSLYEDDNKIPGTARETLKQVYGYGFPYKSDIDPKPVTVIVPAGMQIFTKRSSLDYNCEQTICQ